jgi:mannose-1-phosphate guanylyltransferase
MIHAVIMAGGTGTRFWPLSRNARPKQLLDLGGGRTMIQSTVDRLAGLVPHQRTWVITNRSLVDPIARQLPELAGERIVGEPCKRDTAPAIGLAAKLVLREDREATMVVMPADHLIQPTVAFQEAISQAVAIVAAKPQTLVTFGIQPTYPAETFGYIERGEGAGDRSRETGIRDQRTEDRGQRTGAGTTHHSPLSTHSPSYSVVRFREKPARSVAEEYLASGKFYWNSGIFVWRARTILDALARYEPEIAAHIDAIGESLGQHHFTATLDREFSAIRGKSIDYAVMERHQPVVVIEAPFQWDDVGSWQALTRSQGADADGNTAIGKHLGIRTSGSIIYTSGEHLVVTLGLNNTIVVHTPDATLVADKSQEEAIREVVKELEARGWREYL